MQSGRWKGTSEDPSYPRENFSTASAARKWTRLYLKVMSILSSMVAKQKLVPGQFLCS